jgi:hypothetical protein
VHNVHAGNVFALSTHCCVHLCSSEEPTSESSLKLNECIAVAVLDTE